MATKHRDVVAFQSAVDQVMTDEKVGRAQATRRVCRREPELHSKFLLATNAGRRGALDHIARKFA
jgi:hypothetical protein